LYTLLAICYTPQLRGVSQNYVLINLLSKPLVYKGLLSAE